MGIAIRVDEEFEDKEESIANQRQLSDSLYFIEDVAQRVEFQEPEYLEPVDIDVAAYQRQKNRQKRKDIEPDFHSYIVPQNQRDIFDQQPLGIVFFERRDHDVDGEYYYEKYLKAHEDRHLVCPKLLSKCKD